MHVKMIILLALRVIKFRFYYFLFYVFKSGYHSENQNTIYHRNYRRAVLHQVTRENQDTKSPNFFIL